MASRHSALPFLYPCCNAFAAVPTRRAMMSAFRADPELPTNLATPPSAPSTSASAGGTLNADAAAPQVAARPPPLPKVEKARPKMRASKAALTITPRAVGRLQALLRGPTPQLIRIGVRNKGCAGLSYHLEYVEEAGKFDEVVEQDGVRVLIDSKALFSIIGSEMDWAEDALSFMDFFAALPVARLPAVLADPRTLVVDIRPHAAHADARLPRALSLAVPSTLLRRPLFSLDRLATMLSSAAARHRFAAFHDSARILVYDADSVAIPESSNISALLRKFRAAHFAGELTWLHGGFQAVARELPHLIDDSQHHDDDDPSPTPMLCTRRLPMSAFAPASAAASPVPFFDAVRQNLELSHGITERIPLRLPPRVRSRIADLPVPWLRDIARRADRIPSLALPTRTSSRLRHDLDPSLSDSSESEPPLAVDQGTEALATQFYRIELAEQKRLMGVMHHHSKESVPGRNFPFSITAGVEKGSKNRYQHIWPFEHARVKLCQTGREGNDAELDDYVNASYVQPLATTKKYIATQGPLEATFEDFWRLTWQQNVHVIVMLTQEVENSMVKCGTYWPDSPAMRERTFGVLRVTLMAKIGLPGNVDLMHEDAARARKRRRVTTVKRTFKLEHRGYPNAGARQVVQLQYLDWPDMGVPEDARGVLGLVDEVDRAVRETGEKCPSPLAERRQGEFEGCGEVDPLSGVAWQVLGGRRPVLLHCSAGVGRTGCFIALDAVLDAIRREVRKEKRGENVDVTLPTSGLVPAPAGARVDDTLMEVDGPRRVDDSTCTALPTPDGANSLQKNPTSRTCADLGEGHPCFSVQRHNGNASSKSISSTQLFLLISMCRVHLAPALAVVCALRRRQHTLRIDDIGCYGVRNTEGAARAAEDARGAEHVRGADLGGGAGYEGAAHEPVSERNGGAADDIGFAALAASPSPSPSSSSLPGRCMSRSNTFPLRRARQPLALDLSDVQKYSRGGSSAGSGVAANDAGSFAVKRGASPTELLKEGKKGELLLSKRPSVKRRMQLDLKPPEGVLLESAPQSLRTV
ncbi:hypothetical protein C0993_004702 [Termitomyces sp. T159_Od127]|nr:hypothetical protein C0993_004702 [Termitomyces sp. T159_Od127]